MNFFEKFMILTVNKVHKLFSNSNNNNNNNSDNNNNNNNNKDLMTFHRVALLTHKTKVLHV